MITKPVSIATLNVRGLGKGPEKQKQRSIKCWIQNLEPPPHVVLLEEHHLNGDDCVKYGQVVELRNGMGMWNSAAQLGNSQRWNAGTTILVAPRLSPKVEDHGIIMQGCA